MKRIKIRFQTKEETGIIVEALKYGRVYGFRDNTFVIPESALALLDERGVKYENLGEESWDRVVHALRAASSSKV